MCYVGSILPPLGLAAPWPAPSGAPDLASARQGAGGTSGSGGLGDIPGSSGVQSVCPLNSDGENQMEEHSSCLPPPGKA